MAYRDLKPVEWLEEIRKGLDYRRLFGLEDYWAELEAIYYNVHRSMMNDGANILLSQGDAMLSTITVPNPKIKVVPRTRAGVDKAPLVESVDNLLISEMDLRKETQTAALHSYLFGAGFVKFGYDSEYGYDPRTDMGGVLNLGLSLTQLDSRGQRRIEYDSTVVPGMPWARAVMPHDIVVPWGTRDLSNTPWIAHRIVRNIDDLKADSKYEHTSRLTPSLSLEDFIHSYTARQTLEHSGSTRQADFVEFWEIHDRRKGQILAVVVDNQKFIRKVDNSLQVENRLPFASITFTPRTRALWTTPDAFYLYHIQTELSDVARQRTKQRRIATLKFLYDQDAISDEELETILSPDVGVAAKIRGGHKLNEAIIRLDNQVNQVFGVEEEHLRQNAREQIGFSQNQIGVLSGGRKTATEVSTVDRSSQLRMSRRGIAMRGLYEDSLKIVNGFVFSFWKLPRIVEVLGAEGAKRWQEIKGISLKDRYAYQIELVDDRELQARKFQALQLYSMLSQDPTIDPVALRLYLTQEVNDPAFERIFNARIQLAMSALRQTGGVIQPQNTGGQGTPQLSGRGLPGQNGQVANNPLAGQLAR